MVCVFDDPKNKFWYLKLIRVQQYSKNCFAICQTHISILRGLAQNLGVTGSWSIASLNPCEVCQEQTSLNTSDQSPYVMLCVMIIPSLIIRFWASLLFQSLRIGIQKCTCTITSTSGSAVICIWKSVCEVIFWTSQFPVVPFNSASVLFFSSAASKDIINP